MSLPISEEVAGRGKRSVICAGWLIWNILPATGMNAAPGTDALIKCFGDQLIQNNMKLPLFQEYVDIL